MKYVVKPVKTEEDFSEARNLILQYVEWLGIDLSFQNFENEIKNLPVTYGKPDGGLFIAWINEQAAGIAGIKRFSEKDCEVKRMYVKSKFRGLGLGSRLLDACVSLAKELNYEAIKLDTADFMKAAINLYLEKGFVEIASYRFNPYDGAKYFELQLKMISPGV